MFVHEQIHWFVNEHPDATEKAIADFRAIFPEVPVGGRDGARDENSTYLHLIVCYLEFAAMEELLDEPKAREVIQGWRHYKWIYARVLENGDKLKAVIEKHGLGI